MIDPKALRPQVAALEEDLRPTGEADPALKAEWQEAHDAGRIAAGFEEWLPARVTQVAVAWVLATVFIRFCEDNGLIEYPFIAGPDPERAAQARELQAKFFEDHPEKDDYGWLEAGIAALSVSPVAAGLFDRKHNPMWTIKPSPFAIKELLAFWRKTNAGGQTIYTFKDDDWDTRFLGDLYQFLSESARKMYALLQTPEFVEEFILKYTLDPAIEEFGLEPEPPYGHDSLPKRLRVIDPACGSGHFLLGAFQRLLKAWKDEHSGTDRRVLVANALESVHGVDKNPFAAAIARFRLLLAAMREAGVERLDEQVDFPLYIAVGDSLLHGYRSAGSQGEFDLGDGAGTFTYRTEDIDDYIKSVHMLAFGTYHAVFANPPYIMVRDKSENKAYRDLYPSCYRGYSLSVPFAERIFKLAIRGSLEGAGAGYTGQITANSFMDREFGKKLIEEFFPRVDLTHIVDTSGAYIPGHGTPTVILFGRWRYPRRDSTIRAVLGIKGEEGEPADPANGMVWRAIVNQIDMPGSESDWVSVSDIKRAQFAKHPWSLNGGGAETLKVLVESVPGRLNKVIDEIGFGAVTREDDAYMLGVGPLRRSRIPAEHQRPLVEGDAVRDFGIANPTIALWPYDAITLDASATVSDEVLLWPYRAILRIRVAYGETQLERGLTWFEYSMFFRARFKSAIVLAFAFVSTHNHFILGRAGKVFNRSAPVIKLPGESSEDEHLALLGVLNSSTACFWLKQVSHDKGNRGGERSTARYAWENFYEFTGTKLEHFPLPASLPLERGRELDLLAQELGTVEPSAVCAEGVPTRERLDAARNEYARLRGRMIALQEELDWDVYRRYGLLSEAEAMELIADPKYLPGLQLGGRAFEFLLAERLDGAQGEKQWFERHHSVPVHEIPQHWPLEYQDIIRKRIKFIRENRNIGLVERPEYKRRWESKEWCVKEKAALKSWLLDRCEERSLWFGPDGQPRPITVNRLADLLRADADVVAVARLYASDADADLADVLKESSPTSTSRTWPGFGTKKRGSLNVPSGSRRGTCSVRKTGPARS